MRRLVVIGNGFDIGHGLKTSFESFIRSKAHYEEKYSHFRSGNGNWNEIEKNYKNIILEKMEDQQTEVDAEELVDSLIDEHGFNEYGDVACYGFESEAFKEDIESISPIVYSLVSFEGDFKLYLRDKYSDEQLKRGYGTKNRIATILNEADRIVSFNYTNVVEIIYGIKGVIHIHGNINDEIVIGCDTFKRLEESFVYGEYPNGLGVGRPKDILADRLRYWEYDEEGTMFERTSVKILFDEVVRKTKRNEEELLKLLEMKSKESLPQRKEVEEMVCKNYYDEVHIIGHSLGDIDHGFFDKLKAEKVFCYYHGTEDKDDYKNKKATIEKKDWGYMLVNDIEVFK